MLALAQMIHNVEGKDGETAAGGTILVRQPDSD